MSDVPATGEVVIVSDRAASEGTLDDRLRRAAGRIMASDPQPQDVAEAQRVLTLRAAEIRAPFEAKIRRAKEAAG